MKDDITEEEVISIFRKLDIDVSDVNSSLSSLLSDSKKLQSFLNEVKLLKRRREERLNKETNPADDYLSEESVNEILKKLAEERKRHKQTQYPSPPSITPNDPFGNPPGKIWM